MSIDPHKYIVFNRLQLESAYPDVAQHATPLEDSVVIRLQDIFAAGALYTYASSIRTVVELLNQRSLLGNQEFTEIEHLNELADYFVEMGARAESAVTKVPD